MKKIVYVLLILIIVFGIYYLEMKPTVNAEWQIPLATPSTAEFNGDLVTVRNVRNFRYTEKEEPIPAY